MQLGKGVIDGDPVATILLLYMAFTLAIWLGTNNASINPIQANTQVTNAYSQAYSNTSWILWLSAPLGLYILIDRGFDIRKKKVREAEEMEN